MTSVAAICSAPAEKVLVIETRSPAAKTVSWLTRGVIEQVFCPSTAWMVATGMWFTITAKEALAWGAGMSLNCDAVRFMGRTPGLSHGNAEITPPAGRPASGAKIDTLHPVIADAWAADVAAADALACAEPEADSAAALACSVSTLSFAADVALACA